MTPFGQFWPSAWSVDSVLNAASVAGGALSSNSNTIANAVASPNEVLDTECGLAITYGGTITGGGVIVYICRDVNGTFENPATDNPYSFTMAVVASSTVRRAFTVSGQDMSRFQIVVANPATNSTVTVTLATHQSQGQSG